MTYKDLFIRMKVIQQIAFYKMKNNAFLEFYNQTRTFLQRHINGQTLQLSTLTL